MLSKSLQDLIIKAKTTINQTNNLNDLESVRVTFLGKQGYVNQQFKILHTLSHKDKPKLGFMINQAKQEIQRLYIERITQLESINMNKLLHADALDVSLPGSFSEIGTFHPITSTIERIKVFFNYLGFTEVYGPEVEDNYFNFDALNIPMYHPSRNERDTFWFDSNRLLRTHTSGVQVRIMTNGILPIRAISIGKVYRKDHDKYHTPMFHQIEGIIVDSNLSFSFLKRILYVFLNSLFGEKITLRFRPSYFPFTEPSAEIDMMVVNTQSCKNEENWLELLGCGVIHPKVLYNAGIDSNKFSGLAFGIGIERLAMLLYQISDIRIFFENDLQFLTQFQ